MVDQITKAAKAEAPADPEPAVIETPEVTEPVVDPKAKEEKVKEVKKTKEIVVSHNSTFIEWPTDLWGLTHDLKAAFVAAASRIQGAIDKKRLVDEVINIGRLHLEAKFTVDAKVRQAAIDAVVAENEAKEAEEPAQKELF